MPIDTVAAPVAAILPSEKYGPLGDAYVQVLPACRLALKIKVLTVVYSGPGDVTAMPAMQTDHREKPAARSRTRISVAAAGT